MIDYGKKNAFSKAMLNCVASQLDASSMRKLNGMFEALDSDGSGRLSVSELALGLQQFGLDQDALDTLVDSLDIDGSGEIEYSEFIAGCLDAHIGLAESALFHAFSVFDLDHDGKISLSELSIML